VCPLEFLSVACHRCRVFFVMYGISSRAVIVCCACVRALPFGRSVLLCMWASIEEQEMPRVPQLRCGNGAMLCATSSVFVFVCALRTAASVVLSSGADVTARASPYFWRRACALRVCHIVPLSGCVALRGSSQFGSNMHVSQQARNACGYATATQCREVPLGQKPRALTARWYVQSRRSRMRASQTLGRPECTRVLGHRRQRGRRQVASDRRPRHGQRGPRRALRLSSAVSTSAP
jgi:hypothetical protein